MDFSQYPDAKKHLIASVVKSVIRIAGYGLLFLVPYAWPAAVVLIASEIVGLVEEFV